MSNNSSGKFFGGLMLGATIGALTGLLVAPRTGKQTRQLLKKSANALPELAEDLSTSVQIQADRISTGALRSLDDTLVRLKEALAAGIDASFREASAIRQKDLRDFDVDTQNQHLDN